MRKYLNSKNTKELYKEFMEQLLQKERRYEYSKI